MNSLKLEKNIIDMMQEEQLKLGYRREAVRLYYPLLSLNRLLETECNVDQMSELLDTFCSHVEVRLGRIQIVRQRERFCLIIPAQGSEYVREHMADHSFLQDFIDTISRHGVTVEEVLQPFYHHSDKVHVEKLTGDEFDYLVYFENGIPDDYRYCITQEDCHITYHRFTIDDYNDLQ